MTRTECQFSLIRYVPDAVKNEFVNIGVIVRGGGATAVRFTRDWSRVRCLDPDADTSLLEALEEDFRARLEKVAEGEKPLFAMLEDSLSNSVQITESKGCLAISVAAEVNELLRMYVEPAQRESARERKVSGRAKLVQEMRGTFEQAGVWPLMFKRIAAARFTQPGDPLRIDCGYKNGRVRMFHAVSLESDADAAKVLAFTLPALAAGVERAQHLPLELTAVIEPRQRFEGNEDVLAQYGFGVDVMERAGLRVLTSNDLARAAQTAREELRV